MERKMFCYQCEQTAGCTACTGSAGVCGKRADTARLQDKLTGALIGLARATEGNEYLITGDTSRLVLEGLFTTVTNVNFNNDTITELIRRVEKERERLVPDCFVCTVSCGKNNNYDMNNLWEADEDVRSLKSLILFGIRGVAAYAYHAAVLGYTDDTINRFFENNLNVSETARKLYVHRNTLVYRLEKVKKITGLDLREFEDAILFKVAVMVKQYLDSQNTAKF